MNEPLHEPYPTITLPGDRTAAVLKDATRQIRNKRRPVYDAGQGTQPPAMQIALPFPVDKTDCAEFLDCYLTFEGEIDRLKTEIATLEAEYKEDLPLRAVKTAIKIVRARKKLAEHHKEPMSYSQQARLEGFVEEHIATLEAAKHQAAEEAEASAQRPVSDMTGEGVPHA